MQQYTASYTLTNPNFTFQNLPASLAPPNVYTVAVCILTNLLQRGTLTRASDYLHGQFGAVLHKRPDFNEPFVLIDHERPAWQLTIRGDTHGDVPAKDFFDVILTQALPEYGFIAQLLLPEAPVSTILPDSTHETFVQQRVDFYLPQAFLVIEIDGAQHLREPQQTKDRSRDQFLRSNGLDVIRFPVSDLRQRSAAFWTQIGALRVALKKHEKRLKPYRLNADTPFVALPADIVQYKLRPAAVLRFQLLMLALLQRGVLALDDTEWKFNLRQRDVTNFAQSAFDDLWTWLEPLLRLLAPVREGDQIRQQFDPKHKPALRIRLVPTTAEFPADHGVNVDFSLLKRWTDEAEQHPDVLFVRTDYVDSYKVQEDGAMCIMQMNHFRLSTTQPVRYEIVYEGEYENASCLAFFLKNIYGYSGFRPGQLSIIANALSRKDTIGLLPTGSGKSVCYQLPVLLQPAVSFVVCPIKALMRDQADDLRKPEVGMDRVAFLSSDLKGDAKARVQRHFAQGRYFFVLISPERFQTQSFRADMQALAAERSIAYAVLDEAHCLSEWGHDFRTSYLNLIQTIRKFSPLANVLALTATASLNVLKDLQVEIDTNADNVKTLADYGRPELSFDVIDDKSRKFDQLAQRLIKYTEKGELNTEAGRAGCGLIFTPNVNGQRGCYAVANRLSTRLGQRVEWYAGSSPVIRDWATGTVRSVLTEAEFDAHRQRVQDGYKQNQFGLMVATKAFGMGINKDNIRFTCHFGLPASMESLYQEAGRAGRDKQEAECLIFLTKEHHPNVVDQILAQNTFLEELKALRDGIPTDQQNDLFAQLFLLTNGLDTVDREVAAMQRVADALLLTARLGQTERTLYPNRDFDLGEEVVEKAIYRLKLLNLATDWTVSWGTPKAYTVFVNPSWTEAVGKTALSAHITSYDPDFTLEKLTEKHGHRLRERTGLDWLANALVVWTYTVIVYNRKQSLKNVYDQCCQRADGQISPAQFKKYLEDYFRFDDFGYVAQTIFEQALTGITESSVRQWFYNFYRVERFDAVGKRIFGLPETDGEVAQSRLIVFEERQTMQAQLSRFLESKADNIGLNLLSGLLRALAGQFEDLDGRTRFEKALTTARTKLAPELQTVIVERCFALITYVSDEPTRYAITQTILTIYPEWMAQVDRLAVRLNLPTLLAEPLLNRLKLLKQLNRRLYATLNGVR